MITLLRFYVVLFLLTKLFRSFPTKFFAAAPPTLAGEAPTLAGNPPNFREQSTLQFCRPLELPELPCK
jgi:hypothetical protein